MQKLEFKCQCNHINFTAVRQPSIRIICHCSICQQFNQADFADILVFKSKQVIQPVADSVKFNTYKKPPNVQRGKCPQCGQVAIEVFNFPLMPKLTMIPVGMLQNLVDLPAPKAHMFYDKRVKDIDDELTKHQGFMSSQLAFFKYLWTGK